MGKISKLTSKYNSLPVQVKASLWFLICSFLQKGISVISTPIFTRLMTTTEFGNYNVFNSWLEIIAIFVSFNLSYGVYVQGLVKFSDDNKIFSSTMQGLSLTLCSAWTVIYLLFREFWNGLFSLTTVQMLCMLVMIWTTAAFQFWSADQRWKLKYRMLVMITLLVSFLKPALGVALVIFADDKVTARIFAIALVQVIGYTWAFFVQMKRGKKFFSKNYWLYSLKFNLPLIPHYLSQIVLTSSDRIMISRMVGESEAGIYSLAYSVSMIMTLFNIALNQTLNPWIYTKIKEKRVGDIAGVAYSSLAVVGMVNLLLIVLAPEAIAIFAPPKYAEAIWIVPPVALSCYATYLYDLFAKFQFYFEKTVFIMVASVFCAILNVALNFVFIGLFGYIAAGYTTLFCYIVFVFGHYFFMRRVCRQYLDGARVYDLRILVGMSLGFMAAGMLMLFTYNYTFIRYGIVAAALIALIIKRKSVIAMVKKFASFRKTSK